MIRNSISSLDLSLHADHGPFYQQLIQQIRQGIGQQRLIPGDRLPGSRALADALGVSRSTVVNAYEHLIAEGVLSSRNKSGVFVAGLPLLSASTTAAAPQANARHKQQPSTVEPRGLPGFSSGIDPKVFPAKAWQKSMKASWISPDPMVLKDNCPTGLPALKQAIAGYLFQLRGLNCSADQILITAGSRDALTLIRHTLSRISPGSGWLTENPTYSPLRRLVQSWRPDSRESFSLPVDDEGCTLPILDAGDPPPAVLMTPNRQYPLGTAMSLQRRQQWLKALQQEECWVIEDDYDNEFHYQGKSGIPLMQGDQTERVFFVGSFSKVLFRGLRLGFIVAPERWYPVLVQSRLELGSSAALPMQPVVTEFMNNGEFARHINRMRRHYRQKRDYLCQLADQYLAEWFDWQPPQGGMHLLIRFKAGLAKEICGKETDRILAEELAQAGYLFLPLSSHFDERPSTKGVVPEMAQGFVLGFSEPEEDTMLRLVRALAAHLKSRFPDISV